ncbi:MAG: hypothetical protein FJW97_07030 [Actinobacteria bacterium]|nr:hypothetical protein [Actinomycetota bacterium]
MSLALVTGCGGDDATDGAPMPISAASATIDPAVLDPCSLVNLTTVVAAQLTVATTSRRATPLLGQDDRKDWVGAEADFVYSIAGELGFPPVQVTWIEEPVTIEDFVRDGGADFLIGQVSPDEAQAAGAVASASYGKNPEGLESVLAFIPGNPLATCVDAAIAELSLGGQVTES